MTKFKRLETYYLFNFFIKVDLMLLDNTACITDK